MWSDIETSNDLLGYTVHANLLKSIIMQEKNLPVTIGLYGDWGSGKSSTLKILNEMIEKDADSKDSSVVIYFDGWSFESFDDAKMALIQGIVENLESSRCFTGDLKETVKKAAKTVKNKIFSMRTLLWSVKNVVAPAAMAYATGGASFIPSLISFFGSFNTEDKKKELLEKITGEDAEDFIKEAFNTHINTEQFSAVREFRDSFKSLIKATGRERIVILIDDLDRCLPEHIIENLEAIKLFLNVEKTAFVIAADQSIVSEAIKSQYREKIGIERRQDGGRSIGDDYMDKFIQIPYNIPKLSDQEVESYITLLFCQSMLSEEDFEKVHTDFQKYIIEHKFEGYGWGNIKQLDGVNTNEELNRIIPFMAHCTHSISRSLNRNPRLIKRFLNAFEIRSQLLSLNGSDTMENKFLLLKLMLLETSHNDLFAELNSWSIEAKGHSTQIQLLEGAAKEDSLQKCDFPNWNFDDVKDLLLMEPYFSSVDLREIFWVSRDKLIDGMGGVTLIPKRIKELFNEIYNASSEPIMKQKSLALKSFNGDEIENFYELLYRKSLTDSELKTPYKVYYYLIENDVDKAYEKFLNSFEIIVEKAPISIANNIKGIMSKHSDDLNLIRLINKNDRLSSLVFPKRKNIIKM